MYFFVLSLSLLFPYHDLVTTRYPPGLSCEITEHLKVVKFDFGHKFFCGCLKFEGLLIEFVVFGFFGRDDPGFQMNWEFKIRYLPEISH